MMPYWGLREEAEVVEVERSEELAERVLRRLESTLRSSTVTRVERVEPAPMPSMAALYGVPVYIIGEGYVGQVRRFYHMRTEDGRRRWFFEVSPYIAIYGRRGDMLVPVVVCGFPTHYVARQYEVFLVEERRPFRTVECDEDDIVNLERVVQALDPVLIIDKYGLYRRGVPHNWWSKYVELQEMVRQMQDTVYRLESERSELLTSLRMRETEVQLLREELERLRMQLTKLRAEVGSWYIEYIRLKSEVQMQQEIAEMFETGFNRLRARLREVEETFARAAAPRAERREEAGRGERRGATWERGG